MNLSLTQTLS